MPSLTSKSKQVGATSSTRREQLYGLEFPKSIDWKKWKAGEEFHKKISIKNIRAKTQKITVSSPLSNVFVTPFPEPITLNPGCSQTIPVTFRPHNDQPCYDSMSFQTQEGKFTIKLQALVAKLSVEVPSLINFNMCALTDHISLPFKMLNHSNIASKFQFGKATPFEVTPEHGFMAAKETIEMLAHFKPKEALIFSGSISVTFAEDPSLVKNIKFDGIGKYPHLVVNQGLDKKLDFGSVAIGSQTCASLEVFNATPATARYQVIPSKTHFKSSCFKVHLKNGIIPALQTITIPISYRPRVGGVSNYDSVTVKAIGGLSDQIVQLKGQGIEPKLRINKQLVHFPITACNKTSSQIVTLSNESGASACFHFDAESSTSVFTFSPRSGTILPGEHLEVSVSFKPRLPISYYKRIACFLLHGAALSIEIIGVSRDVDNVPAELQPQHLVWYKKLVKDGTSFLPPQGRSTGSPIEVTFDVIAADKNCPLDEPSCSVLDEFFMKDAAVQMLQPHVSVSQVEFDFSESDSHGGTKTFSMSNHTKGKVRVVWHPDDTGTFKVLPSDCIVAAESNATFNLLFCPTRTEQMHSSTLECFAFYTGLADYRLVNGVNVTPPWSLTIHCHGDSFGGRPISWYSSLNYSQDSLYFDGVALSQRLYQTLVITNPGNLSVMFQFESDQSHISVKPRQGVLLPDHSQSLCVQFEASTESAGSAQLLVKLNGKEAKPVPVHAHVSKPDLDLSLDGFLYFKPTSLRCETKQLYRIHNTGNVDVEYKWVVPSSQRKTFKVQETGQLAAGEMKDCEWTFSPRSLGNLFVKIPLEFGAVNMDGHYSRKVLRVVGEGQLTVPLKGTSEEINLGSVLLGDSVSTSFLVTNDNDCNLPLTMEVVEENGMSTGDIHLRKQSCQLDARSKLWVDVTFEARRIGNFLFIVRNSSDPSTPLAMIRVSCKRASLWISQVLPAGSACNFSESKLSSLFSLDDLNSWLCNENLPHEASSVRWQCGAAPLDADPSSFRILLENPGPVTCHWKLLLPQELSVELEYWAESGHYTDEELHQMKISENNLFKLTPRSGVLLPAASMWLNLSFKHEVVGLCRLPVLLRVTQGCSLTLELIGLTTAKGKGFLHLAADHHQLEAVPIGAEIPPQQAFTMFNAGDSSLQYHFDMSSLKVMQEDNFDHTIMSLENPTGLIEPGRIHKVHCKFWPLESKTYMADLPISVDGQFFSMLTLTGTGYESHRLEADLAQIASTDEVLAQSSSVSLAKLSTDRLCLGEMQLSAISRRVLTIKNIQKSEILFNWHVISEQDSNSINVEPSVGRLEADETSIIKITFLMAADAAFHQIDLQCEVIEASKYDEHDKELLAWRKEKKRQVEEFVITEEDLLAEQSKMKSDSLMPYKALPPIASDRKTNPKTREWLKPEIPQGEILHLGISATVSQNYLSDTFFPKFPVMSAVNFLTWTCEEKSIVEKKLSEILRNLIYTPSFRQMAAQATQEDIPFFCQLKENDQTGSAKNMSLSSPRQLSVQGSADSAFSESTRSIELFPGALESTNSEEIGLAIGRSSSISQSLIDVQLNNNIGTPVAAERDCITNSDAHDDEAIDSRRTSDASLPYEASSVTSSDLNRMLQDNKESNNSTIHKTSAIKHLTNGMLLEEILENTLYNIIEEAFNGDFSITSRPRFVAMIPRSKRGTP